jgi:outer membrane immunogenic protein
MRHLLLAGIGAGLLAVGPVMAADMPVKALPPAAPIYSWTGFYFGGTAGVAFAEPRPRTLVFFSPTGYFALSSTTAIDSASTQNISTSRFTGSVEAGFNYQVGNVVYGLEADYQFLHLNGSKTGSSLYPCCAPTAFAITSSANTNGIFTARARYGYAYSSILAYFTGGLAVTNLNASFLFTDTFATAVESGAVSATKLGWVFGGGIEKEFESLPGLSFKSELLYVAFPGVSVTSTNLTAFTPPIAFPTNVFVHSVDFQALIARVGFNYRFGSFGIGM